MLRLFSVLLVLIALFAAGWFFVPQFKDLAEPYVSYAYIYVRNASNWVKNTWEGFFGSKTASSITTNIPQPTNNTMPGSTVGMTTESGPRSRFDTSIFASQSEGQTRPEGIQYSNMRVSPFTQLRRGPQEEEEQVVELTDEIVDVQVVGLVLNKTNPEKSRAVVRFPHMSEAVMMGSGDTRAGYTLMEIRSDKLVFTHELSPEEFEVIVK